MSDPSEYLLYDASEEPSLNPGEELPDLATALFTFPVEEEGVYPRTVKVSLGELRDFLLVDSTELPTVRFVYPTSGTVAAADAQILLQVTATDAVGIDSVEFIANGTSLGFGAATDNDYVLPYTVPPFGSNNVNIQAKARNLNGRTSSVTSFLFIGNNATNPPAPTFINFVDDAAGGSVQLVPAPGIPMSDYRYKITDSGTYTQAPQDGIISVGNISGSVYAYSVASGTRNISPTGGTLRFSTAAQLPLVNFIAPTNGTTLTAGATVLLRVTASDVNGGNIIVVRLYNGATLIGTATPVSGTMWQIPYTIPAGAGTINFRAEAISEDDFIANASCFIFVTSTSQPTVPGAPTGVTGTAGNGSVLVNGTEPANSGGATVTGYYIYRDLSSTPLAGPEDLPFTDVDVVNGTSYRYQLSAVNAVGEGPKSAATDFVVPTAPGGGNGGTPPTSYHGVVPSTTPNESEVLSLTTESWVDAARTITYNANGTYPAFAEPQSYGIRTTILDGNNFDVTGDVSRTDITLNGVAYYLYVHNNEQYDTAFVLKF